MFQEWMKKDTIFWDTARELTDREVQVGCLTHVK